MSLPISTSSVQLLGGIQAVDFDTDKLKRLFSGRVLLFCHHNADPDSICSAYAIRELAKVLDSSMEIKIILTGGASSLSKRIMDTLGIQTAAEASMGVADALVVLDAATLRQLEGWGEEIASSDAPKVFIDHHAPLPEIMRIATVYLVDEEASSTCEIVYRLYQSYGVTPSAGVAKALLIGIAYDSKHFTIGTAETFRAVSELLEIDGQVDEVLALLASEKVRSERIARLKAGQRMRIHDIEGWTVATSHVNSFQASAARGLLGLGADVAVVAGSDRGIVKISLRSTNRFHRETSIHLGTDVAMPLGEEFDGAGSGHTTSAGVNAGGRPQPMLRRAVELISAKIREQQSG